MPIAVFVQAVALQIKYFRHLLKHNKDVSSEKHTTGCLEKSCRKCCGSAMLTSVTGRQIIAFLFRSLCSCRLSELNHNHSSWMLNFGNGVLFSPLLIVVYQLDRQSQSSRRGCYCGNAAESTVCFVQSTCCCLHQGCRAGTQTSGSNL